MTAQSLFGRLFWRASSAGAFTPSLGAVARERLMSGLMFPLMPGGQF
jgi:hypothetical protein